MEQWEYKFVQVAYAEDERNLGTWTLYHIDTLNGLVDDTPYVVEDTLNSWGDEGWEISGVVPSGPAILGVGGLVILKRRK